MLKAELLEIIANGENSGVEFKRDDIRPEQLAKGIVALANLQGGRLILGVEQQIQRRGSGLNTVHLGKFGGLIFGVKSIFVTAGRGRMCGGKGEFLRLTLRGLIRPRLLSHNNFATPSNNCRYHLFWCTGGNDPSMG